MSKRRRVSSPAWTVIDVLAGKIYPFLAAPDHASLASVARIFQTAANLKVAWNKHVCITDGAHLEQVCRNPRFTSLRIQDCTDSHLVHLKNQPLKHLDLRYSRITDAGLAQLQQLSLQSLNLFDCRRITDDGLVSLQQLHSLQTLTVRFVGDAGLAHFQAFPTLQHLELFDCPLTDAGMVHLAEIPLVHLTLVVCYKLTDAGLYHLRGMQHLRVLTLRYCTRLTDAGLNYLEHLRLDLLDLHHCPKITCAGLKKVQHVPCLKANCLVVCNPDIADDDEDGTSIRFALLRRRAALQKRARRRKERDSGCLCHVLS